MDLYLNNSAGQLSYLERSDRAQYRLPMAGLWQDGLSFSWTLTSLVQQMGVMEAACEAVLDPLFISRLAATHWHVVLADLMFNECGLALAHSLAAPAVGFGFSLNSGPAEFTTLDSPPSFVPVLLTGLSHRQPSCKQITTKVRKKETSI